MHELVNSNAIVVEEKHTETHTTKKDDPEEWWIYKLELDGGTSFITYKSPKPVEGLEKGEVVVVAIGADTVQAKLTEVQSA